ncbi:uncharacterized protein LOC128553214 [Mercenaria mercenaria]|uniref:uncharacterized protein LOC128553214 n=1 Tax=Mercenaria mercenaria TaxID=6596 RepID=UPI00234F40FB|nr:uncharacterized protein LOC128553214 [Mercenaria mercenaria]XP_053390320.1 uncharacterized protein LOC128553214 [Mercenaria mercenaria]
MEYIIFFIFATACSFQMVASKLFTFEVENFAPNAMRMPRSGASGNFTVLFKHGDFINIDFCLRVSSNVLLKSAIYSNDGPSDTVRVSLDEQYIGTFKTSAFKNGGKGWNKFRSSREFPGKKKLDIGRHILTIKASQSDQWGLEIDYIILDIDDKYLEYKDILCNQYCFDVKYDDVPRIDSVPSGKFVQRSTSTQCSEQDNIKIDIYHDRSTNFEIIANLPKYVSYANNREPNYDHCVLASPYWIFGNQTISPNTADVREGDATLEFSGSYYRTTATVSFNFNRLTPTRETDERLIDSVLFVKLRNMPRENVMVKPEYLTEGRWKTLRNVEFTPFDNEHTWSIPERTWDITGENQIKLLIEPGKQEVILDTVKLERRNGKDTTVELYADPDVVFEGVRLSFWQYWQDQPNSMTVTVQALGTAEYFKVDSIRVYVKVPWTGAYSQVFVMFQDGRIRLQAMTPHGLDYIPYGASVYIGQPKSTSSERPYSPIERVDIDPKSKRMALRYADGNTAVFILQTSFAETKLIVKNAMFKRNRKVFPIMTFQSMWIHDGNADTDHVTINGDISRHITSNWRELYGITAVFFKKCISQHNTQAPDIKIHFLSGVEI